MNEAEVIADAIARRMDEAELRKLRGLLYRVAVSGVAEDDESKTYVTVEIDRATWNELAPYS